MDPYVIASVIGGKSDAGWVLRQGVIVSVQSYSVTVEVAGSTTDISGVKYLSAVPPLPGAGVWLLANGSDLLALGATAAAGRCIGPRAYRTTNLSVNNTTDTAVTWEAVDADGYSTWSSGTNPTRLTIKVPGRYIVVASMRWASNGTGFRTGEIKVNGGTVIGRHAQAFAAAGSPTQYTITSMPWTAAVNDYVELIAWQNSGAALNLDYQNAYSNALALEYLGP